MKVYIQHLEQVYKKRIFGGKVQIYWDNSYSDPQKKKYFNMSKKKKFTITNSRQVPS